MTEIDEISARLTVLETVMRQLITHMAVRDYDPSRWVRTRKTLAMSAIDADGTRSRAQTMLMRGAMADFFDQAEQVADDYRLAGKPGTPRALTR